MSSEGEPSGGKRALGLASDVTPVRQRWTWRRKGMGGRSFASWGALRRGHLCLGVADGVALVEDERVPPDRGQLRHVRAQRLV